MPHSRVVKIKHICRPKISAWQPRHMGPYGKVFRIGSVPYNWRMSAHASQAFSIVHCTDSENLPSCGHVGHGWLQNDPFSVHIDTLAAPQCTVYQRTLQQTVDEDVKLPPALQVWQALPGARYTAVYIPLSTVRHLASVCRTAAIITFLVFHQSVYINLYTTDRSTE